VTRKQIAENTGWRIKYAVIVADLPSPSGEKLSVLRDLQARTKAAMHGKE